MQDMSSYQYTHAFNDSAESLPATGEFPAIEAVHTPPSTQNTPTIPSKRPRMRHSHRAMREISASSPNSPPRSPESRSELADSEPSMFTFPANSFSSRESRRFNDSTKSSAISTSMSIPRPMASTPNGFALPNEFSHIDSGFVDGAGQQQAHNGMNRANSMGNNGSHSTDISNSVEDDNPEMKYTDAHTGAGTHSNAETAPETLSRIDQCLREIIEKIEPIRRIVQGSPLRLHHNIVLWEWEKEQKKIDRYQKKKAKKEMSKAKKAMKKEQTAHVNFEREQSRAAKKYVKAMRDKENDVKLDYMGGRTMVEFCSDIVWNIKRSRNPWEIPWDREELSKEGVRRRKYMGREEMAMRYGETEKHRKLEERGGVMATFVRTSQEMKEEERRRNGFV